MKLGSAEPCRVLATRQFNFPFRRTGMVPSDMGLEQRRPRSLGHARPGRYTGREIFPQPWCRMRYADGAGLLGGYAGARRNSVRLTIFPGRSRPAADVDRSSGTEIEAFRTPLTRFFSRNVPEASEVEDLVQEVFLRIVRRGGFQEGDQAASYVFKIASNLLLDRFRRRQTHAAGQHVEFDPELHGDTGTPLDDQLVAAETLRQTSYILMELPERTRAVFVLRRVEGLSVPEIARRLGLSQSSIEKEFTRATRHLLSRTADRS